MTSHTPRPTLIRNALAALLIGLLATPLSLLPGHADDTDLFRTNVPPNILFVVDNSKSMNNSVTHPDYGKSTAGVLNKDQTDCTAFRDLPSGNRFQFWNAGKYDIAKDVNGKKVRGRLSDEGFGAILDRADGTTQGIKNPNAASNPSAPLYYNVHPDDQGKGLAYYYDTGLPILDGSSNHMYWQGGTNAYFETRITPRDAAIDLGIDMNDFSFRPGSSICGVTIPASPRWSLWSGDPSYEVPSGATLYTRFQYLDFLFSDVGASAREAAFAPSFVNDGKRNYSPCLALSGAANEYEVYRRSRLVALHRILETVVCEVNEVGVARFGVAQFRFRGGGGIGTGLDGNVQGGYAVLPINDFKVRNPSTGVLEPNVYDLHGITASHADHLARVITRVGPDSTTPLAETLFQTYTYFMSREHDDLPYGRDADGDSTGVKFPVYSYDTSQPDDSDPKDLDIVGGHFLSLAGQDANSDAPPSPVQYACQKNFILFITDGGSYEDSFNMDTTRPMTDPTDTGQGFDDFLDLIGDHFRNADGTADEVEWGGDGKKNVNYMDDIAYFMNRWDFMPNEADYPGDQNIDTYVVGYAMEAEADGGSLSNLEKTAINGNGLYFESADSDQLAADLVDAIADMIDKAQSFTSATVPASRTADGNNFYSSYFRPVMESPFWEGHLRAFNFTAGGDILTSDGKCAVGTDIAALPPCDPNGALRITAQPFWDAGEEVPDPGSRNLFFGRGDTSSLSQAPVWTGVDKDDLGLIPTTLLHTPYIQVLQPATLSTIVGIVSGGDDIDDSPALFETELDAMAVLIQKHISGCLFDTDCTPRVDGSGEKSLLGDIYHSNPVVVGSPNAPVNEAAYKLFRTHWRTRNRIIYAGSNDGWLHGFHAGTWRTTDPGPPVVPLAIPQHDRGTGVEVMGFMPSAVRDTIRELPTQMTFPRTWYGVDGSAIAADAWLYRNLPGDGAVDATLPTALKPKTREQWRTVLMGGLRQGGRAYYALDVTDPSAGTYPGYLWEFPCDPAHCDSAINEDSEDEVEFMGETWSEPVITRVRVKGDVLNYSGPGLERWVAIFGAGYDVTGDPNTPYYSTGAKAGRAIYMVDITTGEVLAKKYWSSSAEFDSLVQIGYPELRYAIPSAPAVFDLDFDGFADVIYIGDIGGNIWKWVIKDLGDDPINNSSVNDNVAQPDWPFRIFFRGPASTEPSLGVPPDFTLVGNHYQSFFNPPTGVLRHRNLVLGIGSGERANIQAWEADGSADNNNRFYVVMDDDVFELTTPDPDPVTGYLSEDDLANNSQLNSLTCSDLHTSYMGYYLEARDSEKFITNAVVFLGDVITGSFIPADPSNNNPCQSGGTAWLYRFNIDCGIGDYPTGPGDDDDDRRKSIGVGVPTRPRVSVSGLTQGDTSDPCANRVVVVTSDGSVDNDCQGSPPSSGVMLRSWLQR